MKVLLSINPEHIEKIISGEKRYEFRKTLFKRSNIDTIVIYATVPTKKIIGEFDIELILRDDPTSLWRSTKEYAGISKSFFCQYFSGKKTGYAIKIGNVRQYKQPIDPYLEFENFSPPQSFCYLH